MRLDTSSQLQEFRTTEGARAMLGHLFNAPAGRLLVTWPVGVGKSHAIDDLIELVIQEDKYDRVVMLSPTHAVINERRWIQEPPSDVEVLRLEPRPKIDCGSLDTDWKDYEKRGLGALGRQLLCEQCPRRDSCDWLTQSRRQQSAEVVFSTHARLRNDPGFLEQLTPRSAGQRTLTVVDEHGFIDQTYEQTIERLHIEMLLAAIEIADGGLGDPGFHESCAAWRKYLNALQLARTDDLRSDAWRTPPAWPPWPAAVQEAGERVHSGSFRYVVPQLQQFGQSLLESRNKTPQGDITFASPPRLQGDTIVFSGTLDPDFADRRLRAQFSVPFRDHRFEHPDTRWYNLASTLGAQTHFKKNSPQILDFFAGLVGKKIADGKRPLLVSKKTLASLCVEQLNARLSTMGGGDTRVVHMPTADQLADPQVIPLIHYGVIGVNDYEDCDAVYCLNSYYVETSTVDSVLQDLVAEDQRVPIEVRIKGVPKRRVAQAKRADDRQYDAHRLAPQALFQQEMDTVIQTIGRVRPYTKPREVIMFQCGEIPGQPYHREFSNLGEMREYFGVLGQRQQTTATMRDRVRAAQAEGMSQRKVAEALKIARTTVQRHWLGGTPEE